MLVKSAVTFFTDEVLIYSFITESATLKWKYLTVESTAQLFVPAGH